MSSFKIELLIFWEIRQGYFELFPGYAFSFVGLQYDGVSCKNTLVA
jgi:hypothetical protein